MKANDDIVGQKIDNIVWDSDYKGALSIKIMLTNGMIIRVRNDILVDDANADYPLSRWVTIKDGQRVRTPQSPNRGEIDIQIAIRKVLTRIAEAMDIDTLTLEDALERDNLQKVIN